MNPHEKEAFKFCMVCGGEFKTNSDIEKECTKCGYIYFIASKPCAGGLVINEKKEVLLIKRKRNPFKGSLDIPAGFADGSETLEEALKREMMEEVGLEVNNYKYFKSAVGDYDYKGIIKKYLCAFFIIKVNSQDYKMMAGDDAESCRFYNINEIDMHEIKFETTRRIIEDLKLDKCLQTL